MGAARRALLKHYLSLSSYKRFELLVSYVLVFLNGTTSARPGTNRAALAHAPTVQGGIPPWRLVRCFALSPTPP